MKKLIKILSMLIVGIILSLSILIFSINHYTFNANYYTNKFIEFSVKNVAGLDDEGIIKISEKLTKYLKYKNENLDIVLKINGEEREVFNDKEKSHMVDVKNIFINLNKFKSIAILLILLYLIIGFKYDFLRKKDIKNILIINMTFTICVLLGLLILVNTDFTKYFIEFHHIFFNNKLWILDPNKDVLIQLLPEKFFSDITVKILSLYMIVSTIATSLVYFVYRHRFTS